MLSVGCTTEGSVIADNSSNASDYNHASNNLWNADVTQAIEDFLYPLHTIFDFGFSRDSGALASYEMLYGAWFNRYGEQIEPPSYFEHSTVPLGFSLYDFDGDGIPTILVYIAGLGFGGPASPRVYRFVEGEYVPVIHLNRSPSFFADSERRVIVHYNIEYGGAFGYYLLTFTNGGAEKELIAAPNWNDIESWYAHHQYPYWNQNPTIFGMPDEILTPILPLNDLEVLIIQSIRHRHGLE